MSHRHVAADTHADVDDTPVISAAESVDGSQPPSAPASQLPNQAVFCIWLPGFSFGAACVLCYDRCD